MMTKKAVLIMNLGSPDSPSVGDVRRYLAQFLMDECVLDIAWFWRFLLVYFLILPTRPQKSAEAYASVWMAEGSPLLVNSKRFCDKLQKKVDLPVKLAMRYGNPSVASVVSDSDELFVVPMYPHYAMSSFETAVEDVKANFKGRMTVVPPFYQDPGYIQVLSDSLLPHVKTNFEHLLFSYHGLPERHLKKSDPTGSHCLASRQCCDVASVAHKTCYRHQVYRTTALVIEQLGLTADQYTVSFQSRLGRTPWIQPFTDEVLVDLAKRGVKKLHVICPAFVADCLETLEEIEMRGAEIFKEAGGEELVYVPCLNDGDAWVDVVVGWVKSS